MSDKRVGRSWWIAPGKAHAQTEQRLGRALAALHAAGAPAFGRRDRRSTGSRGLPNEPCDTWAEFYATNRLLPLAKLAADGEALGAFAYAFQVESDRSRSLLQDRVLHVQIHDSHRRLRVRSDLRVASSLAG